MLILDASAAVDLVVPSSRTPTVQRLVHDERLHAPHLMYSEALSTLRRMERAQRVTPKEAEIYVKRLSSIPVQTVWSTDWLEGVWSRREWLRTTDAMYVAAAVRLGAPLLTTDQRLGRALADRSIEVITV